MMLKPKQNETAPPPRFKSGQTPAYIPNLDYVRNIVRCMFSAEMRLDDLWGAIAITKR